MASSILWNNVHGPYNTGLPDYWEVCTDAAPQKANWGRPYVDEGPCPRCGGGSIVSKFGESESVRTRRNCVPCGMRFTSGC